MPPHPTWQLRRAEIINTLMTGAIRRPAGGHTASGQGRNIPQRALGWAQPSSRRGSLQERLQRPRVHLPGLQLPLSVPTSTVLPLRWDDGGEEDEAWRPTGSLQDQGRSWPRGSGSGLGAPGADGTESERGWEQDPRM